MEFHVHTTINASASVIFNAWLSSVGHSEMTGGEAEITAIVGDNFTAWDEYITGKNIEITPPSRIVQTWRTADFSDDEPDSTIEILLEETNGMTRLSLTHTNLPAHGEQYRAGWEEHYFVPMKAYFNKEG